MSFDELISAALPNFESNVFVPVIEDFESSYELDEENDFLLPFVCAAADARSALRAA